MHVLLDLLADLFPALMELLTDKKARQVTVVIVLCLILVIGSGVGLTILIYG